jgi:hypothetical protein
LADAERRTVRRQETSILEALGNLGDFIGGIAVVATLVYLALQVRQNTAALRTASWQAVVAAYRESNQLRCDAPAALAWAKGLGRVSGSPVRGAELVRDDHDRRGAVLPGLVRAP